MEAFVCDGVRTPIGRYGGAQAGVPVTMCVGVGQGIALAFERV